MKTITIDEKFAQFDDYWNPRIVAELNGQQVKIAKVLGDFVWHDHAEEDELFFVLKGCLKMEFRGQTQIVHAGELIVVPRGVEHKPSAAEETWIMLIEPATIQHTGKVKSHLTQDQAEWIEERTME